METLQVIDGIDDPELSVIVKEMDAPWDPKWLVGLPKGRDFIEAFDTEFKQAFKENKERNKQNALRLCGKYGVHKGQKRVWYKIWKPKYSCTYCNAPVKPEGYSFIKL